MCTHLHANLMMRPPSSSVPTLLLHITDRDVVSGALNRFEQYKKLGGQVITLAFS